MALWDIKGKALGRARLQVARRRAPRRDHALCLAPADRTDARGISRLAGREGPEGEGAGLSGREAGGLRERAVQPQRAAGGRRRGRRDRRRVPPRGRARPGADGRRRLRLARCRARPWASSSGWLRIDLYFVETPIDIDDLEGYAFLHDRSPIRIAAGEWQNTHFEFLDLADRGRVDVLQPDVGRVGGFTEALQGLPDRRRSRPPDRPALLEERDRDRRQPRTSPRPATTAPTSSSCPSSSPSPRSAGSCWSRTSAIVDGHLELPTSRARHRAEPRRPAEVPRGRPPSARLTTNSRHGSGLVIGRANRPRGEGPRPQIVRSSRNCANILPGCRVCKGARRRASREAGPGRVGLRHHLHRGRPCSPGVRVTPWVAKKRSDPPIRRRARSRSIPCGRDARPRTSLAWSLRPGVTKTPGLFRWYRGTGR